MVDLSGASAAHDQTIHVVVDQALTAWQARQTVRQRWLMGNLPAWAALVFTVLAAIYGVGIVRAETAATAELADSNEARIARLEIAQSNDRSDVKASLAEINANLKILLEDRKR